MACSTFARTLAFSFSASGSRSPLLFFVDVGAAQLAHKFFPFLKNTMLPYSGRFSEMPQVNLGEIAGSTDGNITRDSANLRHKVSIS